jgi:hypothetical protein
MRSTNRRVAGAFERQNSNSTDNGKGWREALAPVTGATVEAMEARVLLSGTAPRVDAGDFYWYQGQRLKLLRATDEIVLGLLPTSARRARRLTAAVTADGGALQGYWLKQQLTPTSYLYARSSRLATPGYRNLLRRAGGFPALKYLAPTFYTSTDPSASREAIADYLDVKFNVGADAAKTFNKRDFSDYAPGSGGSFVAQLATDGGIGLLAVAAALHGDPSITFAEPRLYSEIHLSTAIQPGDQYYNNQ